MDHIPNYLTPPPAGYLSGPPETQRWRRRAGTPTSRAMGPSGDRRSLGVVGLVLGLVAFMTVGVSEATSHPVGLGTAGSFAVLAGAGVTNTGPTVVNGDLGTCPTPAITGFPPGDVNGTIHAADAVACGAQDDLTIAYDDAAGRAPTTTYAGPTDLSGQTLVAGVYRTPTSFAITDTLTLDAQGDPAAVFIFQAGSTLGTAPNSTVMLVNGAQACNVFWQVGSSATLGVGSTFVGTILALTDITANTNAEVAGRLLARNGAVTLDSNVITAPECAPGTTTTTSSASTTSSTDTTPPDTTTTSSTTMPTTTTSSTSTTLPVVTTTLPVVTTTPPDVTTTLPDVTTTLPDVTTTLPDVTTTLPDVTTTLPDVTTTLPDVTTTSRPSTTTTSTSTTSTTTSTTSTTLPSTGTTTSSISTTTSSTSTTLPSTTTTERSTTTGQSTSTTLPSTATTERSTTRTGQSTGTSTTTTTGQRAGTWTTSTAVPLTTITVAGDGGGGGSSSTTAGTDGGKTTVSSARSKGLPRTGSATGWGAGVGVLAIAFGGLVLVVNGRRRGFDDS